MVNGQKLFFPGMSLAEKKKRTPGFFCEIVDCVTSAETWWLKHEVVSVVLAYSDCVTHRQKSNLSKFKFLFSFRLRFIKY